jgi:RimJ/RimL family protein N-acetyltransferase
LIRATSDFVEFRCAVPTAVGGPGTWHSTAIEDALDAAGGHTMNGSPYWITTSRLALRRFKPDDLDWLAEVYGDPEVTRYLGGVKSRSGVEAFMQERIFGYYDQHPGLGMWVTVERVTGSRVGFHLLNHIRGESIIQIGYTLVKDAWGKGFATEMAAAVLRYGFDDLNLPRICAIANLDNYASHRVLLKIGLERRGERAFAHPDYAADGPLAWFERAREG